ARASLPKLHEAQHLVVLVRLPELRVGVAKDARRGILREEGQDPLLPPGALRDVVFLHERVVAMKGDGVEIEVEGGAARKAEPRQRIKPRRHDALITLGWDA